MIRRAAYLAEIKRKLQASPIVSLLGSRQVGKTTLARQIVRGLESHYFDLEDPQAYERLSEPKTALEPLKGVVVIDEIQRRPELFGLLRVLADRRPCRARFLILGSASPTLVRGISESLAGRVSFVDVSGFDLEEVGAKKFQRLWWRGGYPVAYTARTERESFEWREGFIRTFLERDVPQLGITVASVTLRRFWTMVAHYHGQVWNAAEFARSMGTAEATARRYLDILTSTFMVRQLPPWFENLGKRQVKAPKVYIRDPGLLHSLLNLDSFATLQGHVKIGFSWEGFALEQVLRLTAERAAYFWATHTGAELDLMVQMKGARLGFEFKYSDAPSMTKSMHVALQDLKLDRIFVVYPGRENYPIHKKAEVLSILDLPTRLHRHFH